MAELPLRLLVGHSLDGESLVAHGELCRGILAQDGASFATATSNA